MINSIICVWVKRQPYWEQSMGNAILKGTKLNPEELNSYLVSCKEFVKRNRPM